MIEKSCKHEATYRLGRSVLCHDCGAVVAHEHAPRAPKKPKKAVGQ